MVLTNPIGVWVPLAALRNASYARSGSSSLQTEHIADSRIVLSDIGVYLHQNPGERPAGGMEVVLTNPVGAWVPLVALRNASYARNGSPSFQTEHIAYILLMPTCFD